MSDNITLQTRGRNLIIRIKVFWGVKICPQCGSENIKLCGFEYVNQRYQCNDCGKTTYITGIFAGEP